MAVRKRVVHRQRRLRTRYAPTPRAVAYRCSTLPCGRERARAWGVCALRHPCRYACRADMIFLVADGRCRNGNSWAPVTGAVLDGSSDRAAHWSLLGGQRDLCVDVPLCWQSGCSIISISRSKCNDALPCCSGGMDRLISGWERGDACWWILGGGSCLPVSIPCRFRCLPIHRACH